MDYFDSVKTILHSEKNIQKLQRDMLMLVQTMSDQLSSSQQMVITLQSQLKKLTTSGNFNINSLYLKLQEDNAGLQSQIGTLRSEIDELNMQQVSEQEELKQKHLNDKQAIVDKYIIEIHTLQEELDINSKVHEHREQELLNEIQMLQASSAIEMDDIESRLKQQLSEANAKLRESINSASTLRTELRHLKEEFSMERNHTKQKILNLKRSLEYYQEQFKLAQCKLELHCSNQLQDNLPPVQVSVELETNLSVHNKSNEDRQMDDDFEFLPNRFTSRYGSSIMPGPSRKLSNANCPVPPLIALKTGSDTGSARKERNAPKKKRRLYNPDDLSYLENKS